MTRLGPKTAAKIKNPPPRKPPTHRGVKAATKASADKRAREMDNALAAIERGAAPGSPGRPAPKQSKKGK